MSLSIGRKGFLGVGLQSGFGVPAAIGDYVPFMANTIHSVVEQMPVESATGNRDKTLNTISGKKHSEGDVELLLDSKFAGYFLVAGMGSVNTVNLAGSVYQHTITRNNLNTPQYLTLTNDRVVDRQNYYDVLVDELNLEVGVDIAMLKAKVIGNFPQTTTSGTNTTTSGNLFSFKGASFAFGASVAAASAGANLAPHDFKVSIKNGGEAVFRHGSALPNSINSKEFEVTGDFTLYFENTTDRDSFHNQSKQAAVLQFNGNGIGNGYTEQLVVRFYQTSIATFELETGLSNFYAEKVALTAEYDTANSKTLDMLLTNTKSLYI